MNEKILKLITAELKSVIEKYNFKADKSGTVFTNETMAFRIAHDEKRSLLTLEIAAVEEGKAQEYTTASSFLFEDAESEGDATSAGLDFLDTLKGKLGMRGVRTNAGGEVMLPKKDAGGSKNVDYLCAKALALYPQYKDDYKTHVSTYGQFLYIKFFTDTLTQKAVEILDGGNKKEIKKLLEFLSQMYVEGDRTVQNVVAVVVLGGSVRGSEDRKKTIESYIDSYEYLKPVYQNLLPMLEKSKKAELIFSL